MDKKEQDMLLSKKRITLLESLKEQVAFFKERKTVGRMTTEHSIFIPSALMVNQAEETTEFVKVARHINSQTAWNCEVTAEQTTMVKITGIEFVFHFNPDTNFDAITNYIEGKLKKG